VRIASAFAAMAVLGACGRPSASVDGVAITEVDSAGVTVVTISGDAADLPGWELSEIPSTVISGNAAPFLSDVGSVVLRSDGRLVVEDNRSNELHIFETTGETARLIAGAGDGPGEFRNLTALSVGVGDTVYAYDRRLSRISVFDPAGDLLTMIGVDRDFAGPGTFALDAWGFDSDHFVVHSMGPLDSVGSASGPRLEQRLAQLDRLDSLGETRGDPVLFRGGFITVGQRFDGASPFGNPSVVAAGSDRIVRGSGVEYELLVATSDMRTHTIIRWPGWRRPLEEPLVQMVRDSIASRFAELPQVRPERVTALLEAMFAPDLVPATLPALGGVFIDDMDRVWVSRFRPSTEQWSQEESWHVLDASGRPLARLPLPSRTRLAAVRDDRVALIMRDEFDVQHVRVFDIVRGS
jgi:hypothetical protein